MRSLIHFLTAAVFIVSTVPYARAEGAGYEEFFFADIPVVVTASKQEQRLDKAPAVMTVITAEEIQRQGLRSLEEVLQRVAGYYMTTTTDWQVIASRGITADTNYHYLLLYDGHSTGSINSWGPTNSYVIPTLANVDRVEVIRGPGSTLWGGDAALGIINVITKTGKELKGLRVTQDYSSREQQKSSNVMVGGELPSVDGHYLISATYFSRRGWGEKGGNPNILHPTAGAGGSATEPITLDAQMWDPWNPSWEIYGKAKAGAFSFLFRDLTWSSIRAPESFQGRRQNRDYSDTFLEVTHQKSVGNSSTLETKVFTDKIVKGKVPVNITATVPSANERTDYEMYEENGLGAETLLNSKLARHDVKIGAKAVRTQVGPNMGLRPTRSLNLQSNTFAHRTENGIDLTLAAYAEDQWAVTDNIDLIMGGRFDHNNFRLKGAQFSPRAGVVVAPSDVWTVKYLFDTGYVRPAVAQGLRYPNTPSATFPLPDDRYFNSGNAAKSAELIRSQDLQFFYAKSGVQSSLTLFYMYIKDYINPSNLNDGNAISRGVEFDLKKKITNTFELYGNYSFAVAKLSTNKFKPSVTNSPLTNEKNEFLQIPHHLYNVGVNWQLMTDTIWNLHLRGWRDADVFQWVAGINRNDVVNYKTGEYYLDTDVRMERVFGSPLDLSVYSWNLLNVAGREPLALNGRSWRLAMRRTVGVNVSYKFY